MDANALTFNSLPRPAALPVPPVAVPAAATTVVPFTRLAANVKGSFIHELGPVTVFVGPNRRGKTARLDAVRLALRGQHSIGPHASNLWELAPPEATELHASLAGPSGSMSFIVRTENGKAKKPAPPEATGLFARFTANELSRMFPMSSASLLEKGQTLTRENIFRRWGNVTEVPTPVGLSEGQRALWLSTVAKVQAEHRQLDAAGQLAAVGAALRQLKIALGAQIKVLTEASTAVTQMEDPPVAVPAELLPELQRDLKVATAWEAGEAFRIRLAGPLAAQHSTHFLELTAHNLAQAEFETWQKERAPEGAALAVALEELNREREVLRQQIVNEVELQKSGQHWKRAVDVAICDAHQAGGKTAPCLLCSNPHFEPEVAAAQIMPRILARQASVERLRAELAIQDATIRAAEAQMQAWRQPEHDRARALGLRQNDLTRTYQNLTAATEECKRGLTVVTTGLPPGYQRPVQAPTAAALKADIQSIERRQMARQMYEERARNRNELEEKRTRVKVLEEEAQVLLTQCLAATESGAVAAINRYMPAGFEVRLDLEHCEWRVVGRDGRAHGREAMSGSEFGALTVAFVCAYTEGAPARYLVLDDADLHPFDPQNLTDFLTMLQGAVADGRLTQVFLAWSRPHEIPSGCTVVDLTQTQNPAHFLP